MTNKFPTMSAFEKKAKIAKQILYKNDFTLYNLEQLYKGKQYDKSYYKSVKEIREENYNPYLFLENYNKGSYMVALNFWEFDLNQELICSHCGNFNFN
jgi:hypothetical protein